MSVVLLILL